MSLPEDLQRILEMAANLYHHSLAKDPERLRRLSGELAPFGVALSDFKKFRIGYSPASADLLSGYYAGQFASYPAIRERFERLGIIRGGRDALAGLAIFPCLDGEARPEGLIGVDPAQPARQHIPPGQPAEGWLFGLERAAWGVRDHSLVLVAGSVLSFFSLYSILGAIGLEAAVGLAGPRLEVAGLSRLLALGARELYLLAPEGPGVAAACEAAGCAVRRLPPAEGHEPALERLGEVAAATGRGQVRWMLHQAVAAARERDAKSEG